VETAERDSTATIALLERLSAPARSRAGFFPAVRLLERLLKSDVRIGGGGPYASEAIRFSHEESMLSQPNEVSSIKAHPRFNKGTPLERTEWVYEIVTCVLGLTGTDSPLPLYMVAEFVQDEASAELQREFLDMFHNRLTALFYRGVAQYDFPAELLSDASDPVARRALQFAGFDVENCAHAGVNRLQLLHISALFAGGPATPRSLRNSLNSLLRVDLGGAGLSVREFTGGWVPLDREQCNELGRRNNGAGNTFVIGTRVRHPAHEARVVVGPLLPTQAQSFSPGGKLFSRVAALVDTLCPAPATMKLELHIRTRAFPPFVLGRRRIARDACITARRDHDESVTVTVHDLPRVGEQRIPHAS